MPLITIERAKRNNIYGYVIACALCSEQRFIPLADDAQQTIDRFMFIHQHYNKVGT